MLDSSLVYIITRTWPESLILIAMGLKILDVKINTMKSLGIGLVFGVLVTMIRMLPISFGVHTVLSMIVFGLIMYKFSNRDMIKTIITSCIVWIALALSESIYVLISTGILNIPLHKLMDKNSINGALLTLPSLIITILIVTIFNKIKTKIELKYMKV